MLAGASLPFFAKVEELPSGGSSSFAEAEFDRLVANDEFRIPVLREFGPASVELGEQDFQEIDRSQRCRVHGDRTDIAD